jgi:hypothetical protein
MDLLPARIRQYSFSIQKRSILIFNQSPIDPDRFFNQGYDRDENFQIKV